MENKGTDGLIPPKRISLKSRNAIQLAGKAILFGGLIVYPTDTLYGFGVDARNGEAIRRLNRVKGRRKTPISIIAPDQNTVLNWTTISYEDWELVKQYLRGSTTIILPVKKNIVHPEIMGPGHTLGIRIPAHPFGCKLVGRLGFPITTTSVNRTGSPPLNDPDLIQEQFGEKIDILIDGGSLPTSSGSTIYKLEKSKLKIVRP
jgi:L-threonylcarbamoyladenylate synthase